MRERTSLACQPLFLTTNALHCIDVRAHYSRASHSAPLQRLPHHPIDTVVESDGKRELVPMRWGLVPSWWSKPLKEMKAATFNARAETAADKPIFREAFKRSRCLIPASGYYEWQDTPDGKQPYYFTRRDDHDCRTVGPVARQAGWRDSQILRDGHHRRE
jgi:putative SOS response-associated peptidase YedK